MDSKFDGGLHNLEGVEVEINVFHPPMRKQYSMILARDVNTTY